MIRGFMYGAAAAFVVAATLGLEAATIAAGCLALGIAGFILTTDRET